MSDIKFIEQLLLESSKTAIRGFGKTKGWAKDGDKQTVLTETDLAVGRYIVSELKRRYPEDNIVDEESGVTEKGANRTWVVDPIDGTSNFAAGVPTYGIMIGLLDGAIPIAGGFALPSFNQVYLAAKGKGATCNSKPIKVSEDPDLSNLLIAYGIHAKSNYDVETQSNIIRDLLPRVLNIRSSASTFDMAMVASGHYGAFISSRGKIWDCVGPQIVIEESGGVFVHFDGTKIDYANPGKNADKQFSYAMGNATVIAKLTAIIALHLDR